MKRVILLFCCAAACAEPDPIPVWCTGNGTEGLLRDTSDSTFSVEAWVTTDHPCCEGKPRGAVVFKDQSPQEQSPPGDIWINGEDHTAWGRDGTGWKQLTTKQEDHVWTRYEDHRSDTPAYTYGISIDMPEWEFDKADPYTFFFGVDDDFIQRCLRGLTRLLGLLFTAGKQCREGGSQNEYSWHHGVILPLPLPSGPRARPAQSAFDQVDQHKPRQHDIRN